MAAAGTEEALQPVQGGNVDEGDLLADVIADERWDMLLQVATRLAEGLPQFAVRAASARWVQQLVTVTPTQHESVEEVELRLFCQAAVHNASPTRRQQHVQG